MSDLRTAVALALLLGTASAHAEWFQLGRSDAMRLYLDDKAIARNGDLVQIVQLMDFTTSRWVDTHTVVGSVKLLIEYDCLAPRSRALASEAYSEQMGEGRLVSQERVADPQWEAIEPDTAADRIRKLGCGRR